MKDKDRLKKWKWVRWLSVLAVCIASATVIGERADAMKLNTGTGDWDIRWDNSIKYSAGYRLFKSESDITADINLNDGDNNFSRGLISNRFDILSEMDVKYKNIGVRFSGAAWYDDVYNRDNDNTSGTTNHYSVSSDEFTDDTEKIHGKKAELLDAFAFGNFELGSMPTVLRAGRHTLQWGESLFFGSNGIAYGQQPMDLVKLFTVPSSQFKETIRPINQISTTIQLRTGLSIGAYYQFEWEEQRLPAVGSYLSPADIKGEGLERFLAGPNPVFGSLPGADPWLAFYKGDRMKADDQGQGGVMLRIEPVGSEVDYGFYLIHYHDKDSQIYLRPAAVPNLQTGYIGEIQHVYPENITAAGASASTELFGYSIAAEVSYRFNQPLVSDPQVVLPGEIADNDDNERFARGQSLHAQVSAIGPVKKTALWDGGIWMMEIACHQRMAIDENSAALDPNTDKFAIAFRGLFTPEYYQVLPQTDLYLPIGIGWNPYGKSSVIGLFNGGNEGGGDVSIGLKARYKYVWNVGVNYTKYFGESGTFLTPPNSSAPVLSFDQQWADRDVVTFTVERTF